MGERPPTDRERAEACGRTARRLLALVAACAALACDAGAPPTVRPQPDPRIPAALDRAAAFLTGRPLEHDEIWFLTQAAARLGAPWPAWVRELRPLAKPDGPEGVLVLLRDLAIPDPPRLPKPADSRPDAQPPVTQDLRSAQEAVMQLVWNAGHCGPEAPVQTVQLDANTSVRTHGYLLNHQAWALVVGEARGCLPSHVVQPRREMMARQIYAELLASDATHDLDLERAAILCLLGACHWPAPQWWARVIESQLPSGSWGPADPPGVEPGLLREEHAVALAFYALARRWTTPPAPAAAPLP